MPKKCKKKNILKEAQIFQINCINLLHTLHLKARVFTPQAVVNSKQYTQNVKKN